MIKVNRYNTISCVPGVMSMLEVELETCEPVGEYCVDDSHFVPHAENGQYLRAGDTASVQGAYDFPDGKDTGVKIPSNRLHSYTGDIAEASVALRNAQTEARDNVDKSKVEYERSQIEAQASAPTNSATAE